MTEIPHDLAAERQVVGALLDRMYVALQGDEGPHLRVMRSVADVGLEPRHFYDPRCRVAYAVILLCFSKNWPIDEGMVARVCAAASNPEHRAVTRDWLEAVSYELTTIANTGWYARRIVELAEQRRVRAAGAAVARGDGDAVKAAAILSQKSQKGRGGVEV